MIRKLLCLKEWPGPNACSIRCKCGTVWFPPITKLDACPHCGYDWTLLTDGVALQDPGAPELPGRGRKVSGTPPVSPVKRTSETAAPALNDGGDT